LVLEQRVGRGASNSKFALRHISTRDAIRIGAIQLEESSHSRSRMSDRIRLAGKVIYLDSLHEPRRTPHNDTPQIMQKLLDSTYL
jgi:hypothetical protein